MALNKRIMKEIENLVTMASIRDNDCGIVAVTADEISKVDVQFIMPKESLYFSPFPYTLRFDLSDRFPMSAPKVRFLDTIYHANVGSEGRICVDTLSDKWTPALTLDKLILMIVWLLNSPNPDSPLNGDAANNYTKYNKNDPETLRKIIMQNTRHYGGNGGGARPHNPPAGL
jgi:ubiquitin-conjugating enzyme E2 N